MNGVCARVTAAVQALAASGGGGELVGVAAPVCAELLPALLSLLSHSDAELRFNALKLLSDLLLQVRVVCGTSLSATHAPERMRRC